MKTKGIFEGFLSAFSFKNITMKKIILYSALLGGLCLLAPAARAQMGQQPKFPPLALSPMDMSYYPVDFTYNNVRPADKRKAERLVARLIYCRPQKKGREIFGKLEPYGKVYRLGANEATELQFFVPVRVGGKTIPAGRYTVYCIPQQDKWTFIVNRQTDTWGAFGYDEAKDILRTDVPVHDLTDPVEDYTMIFAQSGDNVNDFKLIIAWDTVQVEIPMQAGLAVRGDLRRPIMKKGA